MVTDLLSEATEATWYGMRAWIEGGYQDAKRGGWQWEQTKLTDPPHAERLWLALALATLVGGERRLRRFCRATVAGAGLPARDASRAAERHRAAGAARPQLFPLRTLGARSGRDPA